MTAELHCHSFYSVDGWVPPEEIAEHAAAAGVATLALTDHNCVEGLERCRSRAAALNLRFINGVEFDVKWEDGDYHVLAFGFNPEDEGLNEVLAHNWRCYELNFARWAPIIEERWGVTTDELRAALPGRYRDRPDPPINKWFARSHMIEKGIFPDRLTALKEMSSVGTEAEGHLPAEEIWPFAKLEDVRSAVHGAGGVLLLAHLGGPFGTLEDQLGAIEKALACGFDGFELYHGANTRHEHFEQLVAEAKRLGCAVSGGSDSHSHPDHHAGSIGRMSVPDWVVDTIDAALAARREKEEADVSSPLAAGYSPVIDCHTHIGAVWPDIDVSVSTADAIRMMDRAGIERACSSTSRFLRFDYREGNRVTLQAVREFPNRILGFCLGDPRRPAECAEEIDRCLGDEGFVGIKIHVSHTLLPYDHPNYDAIYARADEYRVPVLAHTFSPPEVNSFLNAARAHPDVPCIVGHSGGFAWANHVAEIAAVPNAFFDLCCSTNDFGRVEAFVAAGGAERVLFGTDLPLLSPAHDLSQVLNAKISDEEKRLILGGNMVRILEARR